MALILDTSFLVAAFTETDVHHRASLAVLEKIWERHWRPVLVPDCALIELMNLLAARKGIPAAAALAKDLIASEELEYVSTTDLFAGAMDIFANQRDTKLSFTDSLILALARHVGAPTVATFDRDFRRIPGLQVIP